MFIINVGLRGHFTNLGYFLGIDIISFGLLLLRIWICVLILIAREKVYNYVIKVKGMDTRAFERSGTITVIR